MKIQGTIMGVVTLPPGTSQERAQEVLHRVRQPCGCRTSRCITYSDLRL